MFLMSVSIFEIDCGDFLKMASTVEMALSRSSSSSSAHRDEIIFTTGATCAAFRGVTSEPIAFYIGCKKRGKSWKYTKGKISDKHFCPNCMDKSSW